MKKLKKTERMKTRSQFYKILFLILGILILFAILTSRYYSRLDITADKRYTLSSATKTILKDLEEPITITAYFSGDLPPRLDAVRKDFRDMLSEYENASDGMIVYEFLDPLKDEAIEEKANREGVPTADVGFESKEESKFTRQKAFMGAVVQVGESTEVLPLISTIIGMEYSLTTAIKKLTVAEKPAVGILQGHGEVSLQQMPHVMQSLGILYEVQPVYLTDSTRELNKFNTLAIVGPKDSLPGSHLKQIAEFVGRGGKILLALNHVTADLNASLNSTVVHTGLESWLNSYGIRVQENLVLDVNCQVISYGVPHGGYTEIRQAMFPYIFVVQKFGEHDVTNGLEQVSMQFASGVNFTGDSSLRFTPLLYTSDKSTTEAAHTYFNVERQWTETDFPVKNLVTGGAIEGSFSGGVPTRMVVIGDADFPLSDQRQQPNPDNINLFANAIDWLSDETGLVTLRTKGATARPIDDLDDGKKTFLKLFNFILPIVLVILIGIFRFQTNRIKRIKRREEGYV
jgi:gliding-associated putative ABC transporter substrate-binding component GldG